MVFPEPVPPPIKMVYPAATAFARKAAASLVRLPNSKSFFIVTGSWGNFRIVRTGPSRATGGMTAFTRSPPESLASTTGCRVLITRLHREAICPITSSSFSGEVKDFSQRLSRPSLSMNMRSQWFTIISVILSSSRSSSNTSIFLRDWKSSFFRSSKRVRER